MKRDYGMMIRDLTFENVPTVTKTTSASFAKVLAASRSLPSMNAIQKSLSLHLQAELGSFFTQAPEIAPFQAPTAGRFSPSVGYRLHLDP